MFVRQKSYKMQSQSARWVLGHRVIPQEVSGNYDLILGETPGQTDGPPPHLHNAYHEVFIVTEGQMDFVKDGKPQTVRAGESINLPPQVIHTFANRSDTPCKWINIHSPKGFLKFFDEIGVSEENPGAQEKSLDPQIIEQVIRTAADYDMMIKIPQEN